jgi:3',5'-cyclic AMP phosphodiesterase CpdA
MARLATMLEETGRKGRFRLVLIHHPPLDATTTRRKRLVDSQAFRETIARTGCELVLHGHNHMHDVGEIAGADGPVPVLGLPSASSSGEGTRPPAHYALLAIRETSEGWRVDVRLRCYDPATGRFAAGPATVLDLARTKPARVTVCP